MNMHKGLREGRMGFLKLQWGSAYTVNEPMPGLGKFRIGYMWIELCTLPYQMYLFTGYFAVLFISFLLWDKETLFTGLIVFNSTPSDHHLKWKK